MLELFVASHIAGGACLAAAFLQTIEPRKFGPVAPTAAAAAFAVIGLGLILFGHFTV